MVKEQNNFPTCPVCHGSMNGSVCATCGWVQIDFPKIVPTAIKSFNEARRKASKSIADNSANQQSQTTQMREKNEQLTRERDDARKNEKSNAQRIRDIEAELNQAKKEREQTSRELAKARNENTSLQQRNDKLSEEIAELRRILPAHGAQLRIEENNGKFTLFDTSGTVCRANGTPIGKSGIELNDGYVFRIGELQFRVKAPEFNLDNLQL